MITGKFYRPYDNSWCANVATGTRAMLVPNSLRNDEESDCRFEIVSEPYDVQIEEFNSIHTFINVKSSNTGNVYRTIFCEGNVIN